MALFPGTCSRTLRFSAQISCPFLGFVLFSIVAVYFLITTSKISSFRHFSYIFFQNRSHCIGFSFGFTNIHLPTTETIVLFYTLFGGFSYLITAFYIFVLRSTIFVIEPIFAVSHLYFYMSIVCFHFVVIYYFNDFRIYTGLPNNSSASLKILASHTSVTSNFISSSCSFLLFLSLSSLSSPTDSL